MNELMLLTTSCTGVESPCTGNWGFHPFVPAF